MKNLSDILAQCSVDKSKIKVTLNKRKGNFDPELELIKYKNGTIDDYKHGLNIAWTGGRVGSRFKKGDIIIQLIKQYGADNLYICGSVSTVVKVVKNENYSKEAENVDDRNRWIVYIKPEDGLVSLVLEGKYFRNNSSEKSNYEYQFKCDDKYIKDLELVDNFISFPGKEYLNCTYAELKEYIDLPQWKAALMDIYAIYLITDISNGKMYVGSATSKDGGLYSRWKSYIDSGDGGNVDFKTLSKEYIETYFSYSILEEFGKNTSRKEVIRMEIKWKDKLHTRKFGYNNN